jgi:hypothetical protein
MILNPAYGVWIVLGQQVIRCFLLKGFSQDNLTHVLGLEHAAEVRSTIDMLFKEQPQARIGTLRAALVNTKKARLERHHIYLQIERVCI